MAVYFSSDMTLLEMQNSVLRSLHEPVDVGSEAVPMDLVKDKLNEVYANAFNDQRMKQSARENNVSFALSNDTKLSDDLTVVGAVTINVNDASTYLTAGKLLLFNEIVSYTGKTATSFTGVTGVSIDHVSGESVRQLYPLATIASDIDAEQIQLVNVNGIPYHYKSYERLVGLVNFDPLSFTVYKNNLLFSPQAGGTSGGTTSKCFLVYTQKVTTMTAGADKPALIPNEFRVPILVYGACTLIAAEDAFRTSWDFWQESYKKSLSEYIAFKNKRVLDHQNRVRPSIYRYMPT